MRFKIVTKWNSNNRGNKKSFKFSLSNSSLICGKVLTGSAGFFLFVKIFMDAAIRLFGAVSIIYLNVCCLCVLSDIMNLL